LFEHVAVQVHELLDLAALERREDGLDRLLDEDGVEPVLVADRVEHIELHEGQAVSLAVFKLLEEFGLSLVVEVRVLCLLHISHPDSRVHDLTVLLDALGHALRDRQRVLGKLRQPWR
jgi:hypothetical protein